MLDGIREAIGSLESRLDKRLQAFEERMDGRFAQMDRRFEQMDRRFEQIDQRFLQVDQRIESFDAKSSRQFVWLVGLYVTTLIAMIGALGGVIAAILAR